MIIIISTETGEIFYTYLSPALVLYSTGVPGMGDGSITTYYLPNDKYNGELLAIPYNVNIGVWHGNDII